MATPDTLIAYWLSLSQQILDYPSPTTFRPRRDYAFMIVVEDPMKSLFAGFLDGELKLPG
jgi:hypothetical protein